MKIMSLLFPICELKDRGDVNPFGTLCQDRLLCICLQTFMPERCRRKEDGSRVNTVDLFTVGEPLFILF